jgi:hypothetical protein
LKLQRRTKAIPYDQPDKWGWSPSLSGAEARRVGKTTLALWRRSPEFRRHLSIDFTLPLDVPTPLSTPDGAPVHLIPVAMLRRLPGPMHYDVKDETGRSLPLVNEQAAEAVTAAALFEFARNSAFAAGVELTPGVESILTLTPYVNYARALKNVRAMLTQILRTGRA